MTKIADASTYPRYYRVDWQTWRQRNRGFWHYVVMAEGECPRVVFDAGASTPASRVFLTEADLQRNGYQLYKPSSEYVKGFDW